MRDVSLHVTEFRNILYEKPLAVETFKLLRLKVFLRLSKGP